MSSVVVSSAKSVESSIGGVVVLFGAVVVASSMNVSPLCAVGTLNRVTTGGKKTLQ